ncbi:hypothetical protein GQ44DRAFT_780332 [Phaeosphaeriaceae sp. PMI808]|nr:hypothetical protein GQ44DRAFT_780332 [Phaeosphaeriaceae sp. PMI808]
MNYCPVASDGQRTTFLDKVFELQNKTRANTFATARFIADAKKRFESATSLEIWASSEDVRSLDGHMPQLPRFVISDAGLQESTKARIIEFLLALLHLDSLLAKTTAKAVKIAPEKLPTEADAYDYAYKDAMERIEGQLANHTGLAKRVLLWITYAERPLITSELHHALAVEVGKPELDRDNFTDVEDMVSVCAGLVTIDEDHTIRLVHYTAQEYFGRIQRVWFPNAEAEIARTCISYLSFSIFETRCDPLQVRRLNDNG